MRPSTEPYCFIMLAPRARRGGTMRPENSSKLWLNTRCERSRESTAWSSVTPPKPDAMADCEMPLEAASDLKSSSHAPKLPVPQGAASTDAAGIIRTALNAMALDRHRKLILQNVRGNRGQNKAFAGLIVFVIGRQTAGQQRTDGAMITRKPKWAM